ncbi:hypothetical protein AB0M28_35865 [Streptomyces sp. NPDC051940]|uniref:hypothetical protein n=1 Tax=Streptomyces sp. NPDC051940 TaxID=3155675 RepID=UPI003441ED8A
MDDPESELRRMRGGPGEGEDAFVIRVSFDAGEPGGVIERARDVLGRVVGRVGGWPEEGAWPGLLPGWFVERCAPEVPDDPSFDADAWSARWSQLSLAEKVAAAEGPWALSDWLYYFDPTEEGGGDDRSW